MAYTLPPHLQSVIRLWPIRGEIMTTELHGKVGIVTGGTSGIGRDAAVLFAKAGAKVVVAGRREVEGKETIDLVRAAGGDGLFVKTDVSQAAEVHALVQKTVQKYGRLDIAFNNAGIEGRWIPIAEQSEEDWDRTININLKGTWLCESVGLLRYDVDVHGRRITQEAVNGSHVKEFSPSLDRRPPENHLRYVPFAHEYGCRTGDS